MKKTTLLTVTTLVVLGMSLQAAAATFKIGDADFRLSGSLRYEASYQLQDRGSTFPWQADSITDWHLRMPNTSRVGLWTNYDKLTGFVELGLNGANESSSNNAYTRHAYVSYDLGSGNSLLIGQTWSILALHFPGQVLRVDTNLFGMGNLYSGRNPQIRFTHTADNMSFSLAIEDNDDTTPEGITSASYLTEELTPALLASLTVKADENITLTPSALVQRYELKSNAFSQSVTILGDTYTVPVSDIDVLAWALALDGTIKADPVTLDFEAWFGQNVGAFADAFDFRATLSAAQRTMGQPCANLLGTGANDVMSMGGWIQISVPLDPVTLYAGLGLQQSEVENEPGAFYESEVTTQALFLNAKYNLTKQLFIQPGIAYFAYGDDAAKYRSIEFNGTDVITGNDLGHDLYIGCFFQYDF